MAHTTQTLQLQDVAKTRISYSEKCHGAQAFALELAVDVIEIG